jgi:hypothetical protein
MIKQHSDDPDVYAAAEHAARIVREVLGSLPKATAFDYGGHQLKIGDYDVCHQCTEPIAEAQQACLALVRKADETTDPTVKEHLQLAAQLLKAEAQAAEIRAEFHNGHGSEAIVNELLGFIHDRAIFDTYDHHHGQEN